MDRSGQARRLAQFIREEQKRVLQEFEELARTHASPGATMDIPALRDHAASMLSAIALDIEQPQSEAEQERKSKGKVPTTDRRPTRPRERGGQEGGRAVQGVVAESRHPAVARRADEPGRTRLGSGRSGMSR